MSDLVQFLRDRLDEEAAEAQAAADSAKGEHWYAHARQTGRRTPREYVGASTDPRLSRSGSKPIRANQSQLTRYIARHDPASVLRDITADRALLAAYEAVAEMDAEGAEPEFAYGRAVGLGEAVRYRAARFDNHPDYDEAWRPSAE